MTRGADRRVAGVRAAHGGSQWRRMGGELVAAHGRGAGGGVSVGRGPRDGAHSGTDVVTGDPGGPCAYTGRAGAYYSHSPSRAVAVRPGAAA